MENPVTLLSHRAMGVLGKLIREWSLDPKSRPPHRMEGDRICVMTVGEFRRALEEENGGRLKDSDIRIRDGVEEVELILRDPGRFSVLLPEEQIMTQLLRNSEAGDEQMIVQVPRIYVAALSDLVSDFDASDIPPAVEDDTGTAMLNAKLNKGDPFRTFLDPYMAAYTCTQCL